MLRTHFLPAMPVPLDKEQSRVVTSDVDENNRKGVGKNRRTGEYLGGGFVSQTFTRGKEVRVSVETTVRFRLEKPLVLRPAQ